MLGNALIQIGIITGDKNDRIESNRRISFRSPEIPEQQFSGKVGKFGSIADLGGYGVLKIA